MAADFGFTPVSEGKRYFISYKSEDAERVGEIARELNRMEVPLWYDNIEKGIEWEAEISRQVSDCEALLLFVTNNLFASKDPYVKKEVKLAKKLNKKVYPVWLDDVDINFVNKDIRLWYISVDEIQGIKTVGKSVDEVARCILKSFHFISVNSQQFVSSINHAKKLQEPESKSQIQFIKEKSNISQQTKPTKRINSMSKPVTNEVIYVGSMIQFGEYQQDANEGKQPLNWRVLDLQDDVALLITDKLIDCLWIDESERYIPWEKSSVRKWLNNYFLFSGTFGDEVQMNKIVLTNLEAPKDKRLGTNGGYQTNDRIFALSFDEYNKYLEQGLIEKKCYATDYAQKQGLHLQDWWFLRGANLSLVGDGPRDNGWGQPPSCVGVRPVLRLKL